MQHETKPNGTLFPQPNDGPYERPARPPVAVPAVQPAAAAVNQPPQVMELPTRFFRPLPGNRKVTLEDVTRSGLLENIRLNGQISPGLCTPDREPGREGCWLVVGGNSRWLCCDALGLPFRFLPVEGDASLARMVRLSLADNVRISLSLIEVAEQLELFMRETGVTRQEEVAEALGLGQPEVSRALALPRRLAPSLHEKVRNFEIPRSIAEALARLEDHGLQEKAAAHYLSFPQEPRNRRPTRERFEAYVDALRPGGKARRAPPPVKVSFAGFKGAIHGDLPAALKAMHARLAEVLKRIDRGDLPPEAVAAMLPSLLK